MQRQGAFRKQNTPARRSRGAWNKFLAEMEAVVLWARLAERLRPLYPKGERGRPPIGLERMLRIYFVQQWYGLADEAVEVPASISAFPSPAPALISRCNLGCGIIRFGKATPCTFARQRFEICKAHAQK